MIEVKKRVGQIVLYCRKFAYHKWRNCLACQNIEGHFRQELLLPAIHTPKPLPTLISQLVPNWFHRPASPKIDRQLQLYISFDFVHRNIDPQINTLRSSSVLLTLHCVWTHHLFFPASACHVLPRCTFCVFCVFCVSVLHLIHRRLRVSCEALWLRRLPDRISESYQ